MKAYDQFPLAYVHHLRSVRNPGMFAAWCVGGGNTYTIMYGLIKRSILITTVFLISVKIYKQLKKISSNLWTLLTIL